MGDPETANWDAVLAQLDEQAKRIQITRDTIVALRDGKPVPTGELAQGMPLTPMGPSPMASSANGASAVAQGAFLGLSIGDAARQHLSAARKKMTTNDLQQALEIGGIKANYGTIYNSL